MSCHPFLEDARLPQKLKRQLREARKSLKLHAENQQLKGKIPRAILRMNTLQEVWLQQNRLSSFADTDQPCWEHAELVYLADNDFAFIPSAAAGCWTRLEEFNCSNNPRISTLPDESNSWTCLRQIYLDKLPLLTSVPMCGAWEQLRVLHVNGSGLTELPEDVCKLVNLTSVALNDCKLTYLPRGIGKWTKVVKFFINNNNLRVLPDEFGEMTLLEKFYASSNQLEVIPESVGQLTCLQELYLSQNRNLQKLPSSLANCENLNKLYVNECDVRLDPTLFTLPAKSLEILNLSGNANLRALPLNLGTFKH